MEYIKYHWTIFFLLWKFWTVECSTSVYKILHNRDFYLSLPDPEEAQIGAWRRYVLLSILDVTECGAPADEWPILSTRQTSTGQGLGNYTGD
jgi:hypothetical protein